MRGVFCCEKDGDMKQFGVLMILMGGAIAALGALFLLSDKFPFLGRLPGDIHVEGKNASFHFPIVTCLIASVVLTIALNVIVRLLKK
jgi:hypothetical protein